MKRLFPLSVLLLAMITSVWCSTYNWGSYQQSLLSHFKKPDRDKLDNSFTKIVSSAESSNKVPPGLYAETGFVKYEKGDYVSAIAYFRKEKELWPESQVFMDKMIRSAQNGGTGGL